jgi:hypothetical protein
MSILTTLSQNFRIRLARVLGLALVATGVNLVLSRPADACWDCYSDGHGYDYCISGVTAGWCQETGSGCIYGGSC